MHQTYLYMCEFIYIHILSGAHILAVPGVLGLLLNTEPIQDPESAPQIKYLALYIPIRQHPKRRQGS